MWRNNALCGEKDEMHIQDKNPIQLSINILIPGTADDVLLIYIFVFCRRN